jgi:hypothetical protein
MLIQVKEIARGNIVLSVRMYISGDAITRPFVETYGTNVSVTAEKKRLRKLTTMSPTPDIASLSSLIF